MSRPRLLDLYSCAGGAAMGYYRAGFDVVGVDIIPQPRYPFEHHVGDALEFAEKHALEFDAIHASPPCQLFTIAPSNKAKFPDLVGPTRDLLTRKGIPWVMENVVRAPLKSPILLCGTQFGLTARDVDGVMLKLVRHRLFESPMFLYPPSIHHHDRKVLTASVYGAGGGWTPFHRDSEKRRGGYIPATSVIQELMGIDWMTKHEMSEAIPPAMTEWIGRQLMAEVLGAVA